MLQIYYFIRLTGSHRRYTLIKCQRLSLIARWSRNLRILLWRMRIECRIVSYGCVCRHVACLCNMHRYDQSGKLLVWSYSISRTKLQNYHRFLSLTHSLDLESKCYLLKLDFSVKREEGDLLRATAAPAAVASENVQQQQQQKTMK